MQAHAVNYSMSLLVVVFAVQTEWDYSGETRRRMGGELSTEFKQHCETLGLSAYDTRRPPANQQSTLRPAPGTSTLSTPKARSGPKRRVGVSAETADPTVEHKKIVFPKSEDAMYHILAATEQNAIFAALTSEQQRDIAEAMFQAICVAGQVVIEQGDVGNNFYIVDSGEYEVLLKQTGERRLHTYRAHDSFGELALMYNCPRAATVRCISPGVLWALDRVTFRHILLTANQHAITSTSQFLKSVSVLASLTDEQRGALASTLEEADFDDGEYVVSQGEAVDALLIVKRGELALRGRHHEVTTLRAGDFFNEAALLRDAEAGHAAATAVVDVDAVAQGRVSVLRLTLASFTNMFGDLRAVMRENFSRSVLRGMDMFRALTVSESDMLVESLVEESFAEGTEIIRQGEAGHTFYIIKSGSVRVTQKQAGSSRVETIKDRHTLARHAPEQNASGPREHHSAPPTPHLAWQAGTRRIFWRARAHRAGAPDGDCDRNERGRVHDARP